MTPENAVYGRCTCGHVWAVVHLPMQLDLAAKAMSRATCPKCGNTKGIKVANRQEVEDAA